MIYIKVPQDTVPGEIIGLTTSNTFTTCARCGREMPMYDAFMSYKKDPNFFACLYICVKCFADQCRMEQMAWMTSLLELPVPEENQEDNKDEQ